MAADSGGGQRQRTAAAGSKGSASPWRGAGRSRRSGWPSPLRRPLLPPPLRLRPRPWPPPRRSPSEDAQGNGGALAAKAARSTHGKGGALAAKAAPFATPQAVCVVAGCSYRRVPRVAGHRLSPPAAESGALPSVHAGIQWMGPTHALLTHGALRRELRTRSQTRVVDVVSCRRRRRVVSLVFKCPPSRSSLRGRRRLPSSLPPGRAVPLAGFACLPHVACPCAVHQRRCLGVGGRAERDCHESPAALREMNPVHLHVH